MRRLEHARGIETVDEQGDDSRVVDGSRGQALRSTAGIGAPLAVGSTRI